MASTLVANPWVHVEMAANLVNPKLQCNSRKRRKLRTSSLRAASRPDRVSRSPEATSQDVIAYGMLRYPEFTG